MDMNIQLINKCIHKKVFKKHISCKRKDQSLTISIPKALIYKELLDKDNGEMERILQSGDGRVLMCGRIII